MTCKRTKTAWVSSMIILSALMIGCQKKEETAQPQQPTEPAQTKVEAKQDNVKDEVIPAVWAKPYRMQVSNKEVCHPESADEAAACTRYDLQSIKTNIDWINDYYDKDIQKNYSKAFDTKSNVKLEGEAADNKYYEGVMVSFVAQRYQLVTFAQFYNAYSGGAHNIYHTQYHTFDLASKRIITLNDILKPNAKAKILALLKAQNASNLQEYGTDLDELKLSENFYFGDYGLVFVYSLYEIAPFVVGMPELSVSYEELKDLVKEQYLPVQPDTSLSREFS